MFPSAVAVLAVTLGAVAGFLPGWGRGTGPFVRSFAMVAALGVAAFQLLPEGVEALGGAAAAAAALGYAVPALIGWVGARVGSPRRATRIALEVGWAALLVHQVGDGLALGAMSGGAHAGHGHADLVLALSAHTVPLATMTVLTFRERFGRGVAVARALGLALATLSGIAAAGAVSPATLAAYGPWISAVVAGGLLHLAIHDLPSGWARGGAAAPAGALIGVMVAGVGAVSHADEHPASTGSRLAAGAVSLAIVGWFAWRRAGRAATTAAT